MAKQRSLHRWLILLPVAKTKTEALTTFLKSDNNNIEVANIKAPDFTDRQKPLKITYDFKATMK
jgi:hypothetical protein